MSRFEVLILGNSSALPAYGRHPSGQVVNIHEEYLLIDCGEGTQDRLIQYHIKPHKLEYIFISHLHGDHYFGLPGLITSMNLSGRKHPLRIYSPEGLSELMDLVVHLADSKLNFDIEWNILKGDKSILLVDDGIKQIKAFPLSHRIPTYGFVIRERPGQRIFRSDLFDDELPSYEVIKQLKAGHDIKTTDGKTFLVSEYTFEPDPPRSYAYCSDTVYDPSIVTYIQQCNLLYHEATYAEIHNEKAKENFHSTASDAAEIALKSAASRLLIGHFSSRYKLLDHILEEARLIFDKTEIAVEGNWFKI